MNNTCKVGARVMLDETVPLMFSQYPRMHTAEVANAAATAVNQPKNVLDWTLSGKAVRKMR
jgi:hypothetical protein